MSLHIVGELHHDQRDIAEARTPVFCKAFQQGGIFVCRAQVGIALALIPYCASYAVVLDRVDVEVIEHRGVLVVECRLASCQVASLHLVVAFELYPWVGQWQCWALWLRWEEELIWLAALELHRVAIGAQTDGKDVLAWLQHAWHDFVLARRILISCLSYFLSVDECLIRVDQHSESQQCLTAYERIWHHKLLAEPQVSHPRLTVDVSDVPVILIDCLPV